MSDGVIYGVEIDRSKETAVVGPVVTFVARLPHWVILDPESEYNFRRELHAAMQQAIETVTKSEKSSASRRALNEARACQPRPK